MERRESRSATGKIARVDNRQTKQMIVANAYLNDGGEAVAFIDESYLAPSFEIASKSSPFYLMTAYVIPRADLASMRSDLEEDFGSFWHSTQEHRSGEGRERIRAFATYVGGGDEAIIVSLLCPVDEADGDAEGARAKCFSELLSALSSGEHCPRVTLAVFEERKFMNQRAADGATVKAAYRDGVIPRGFRVLPTSPSIEPLLWLPDVVSFALYQRQARTGFDYANAFEARVIELRVK